jgi:hypothetical protein
MIECKGDKEDTWPMCSTFLVGYLALVLHILGLVKSLVNDLLRKLRTSEVREDVLGSFS